MWQYLISELFENQSQKNVEIKCRKKMSQNRPTPSNSTGSELCWEHLSQNRPTILIGILHYENSISDWWFGTLLLFFHSVGNVIIPTVTHSIIFRVGRKTTNQNNISIITNHIDPP